MYATLLRRHTKLTATTTATTRSSTIFSRALVASGGTDCHLRLPIQQQQQPSSLNSSCCYYYYRSSPYLTSSSSPSSLATTLSSCKNVSVPATTITSSSSLSRSVLSSKFITTATIDKKNTNGVALSTTATTSCYYSTLQSSSSKSDHSTTTVTTTPRHFANNNINNNINNNNYIQKRHKVFVSKHNQTLNLTPHQITDYLISQLPHLTNNNQTTTGDSSFRITSTHVIVKECPFCSKPTNGKYDNMYKLYVQLGGGAYFCHRCGAKGSWYDLKCALGGFRVESASSGGGGQQQYNGNQGNKYGHGGNYNTPQQQQQQPQYTQQRAQPPQPLPMPHPKLNSIHSSALFSPPSTTNINSSNKNNNNKNSNNKNKNAPNSNKAMQYLLQTRGLSKSVLRKYGVGCATYKFPSNSIHHHHHHNNKSTIGDNGRMKMEYVNSTCITFPWLMRQSEVEELEELRGVRYVWRKEENNEEDHVEDSEDEDGEEEGDGNDNDDDKKKKKKQREMMERESKQRMEAAVALEVEHKKNQKLKKARSEMTALERYYAKKERRSVLRNNSNTKKKGVNHSKDEDGETNENDDNNRIMDQFQFTPPSSNNQLQPTTPTTTTYQQLTPDEIESLHGPYITRRIKVRSIDQKSNQRLDPPGGGMGLFGWHTIPHDATEIIITEGEFDAMAVYQATQRPTVSLPNGCRSLPMEVLVLLERFDTVYLWMDNDGPGREGAEMFARKLGVERCLLVQPSGKRGWNGGRGVGREYVNEEEDKDLENVESILGLDVVESDDSSSRPPPPPKDANEALLQGWDINELLNEASELPHERILKFSDLRDQVIHEITNPDKYRGVPVPSLPGFTSLIKGFRRGEMTVLTGPTGSGKTTFLGQTSLDLAEQGVNVLWGSFEIKNTRLMHKLLQQYMKDVLPIGLAEREGSMEEKKKMYEALTVLADKFDTLPMYFMKFHGGSDIDDVLDAMEYAAYVHDVEHIILDNMQFMISRDVKKMSSSFDKFDMQDIAIEKFRKFATDYNVHVTLVVHPRKEDEGAKLGISSFYGSAKATQEADTVLILQSDGKRKFVDVKKNRFDGTLGHVPLYFERKSGRYTEDAPTQAPPKTVVPNGVGVKTFNGVGHQKGRAVASSTYGDIRGQHPI